MPYIDLHVHSNASDGTFTPSELVTYAKSKNLCAFALTDHDTVAGIEEALREGERQNIQIIPGIELSTDYNGHDIHVLGLNIDYTSKPFLEKLDYFNLLRAQRNETMCSLLEKEGFEISIQKLHEMFGDTVLTRAHFARYLLEKGYISSMKEAFDSYISHGCPCYVPKVKCSPAEAIQIIKTASGTPVLAHPLLYHFDALQLEQLVSALKQDGLQGIEVFYSTNEGSDEEFLLALAKKHNLYITGGSDFHGSNKPDIDLGIGKGNLRISASLLEQFMLS
jgi:predicted metal-dependent phosphoesterase TrpH